MVSIFTLIFLEIILSIDNLVFLSSLTSKLSEKQGKIARFIGLCFALSFRFIFIFLIQYFFNLEKEIFKIFNLHFNFRDLIFLFGGLFLIYKTIPEIFQILFPSTKKNKESEDQSIFLKNFKKSSNSRKNFYKIFFIVILEIIFVDFIFSIDSVLVAIALSPSLNVLIVAMIISMLILFFSVSFLTKMLIKFPSMKLLCMFFIILIGFMFVLQSFGLEIPRSYINTAFIFGIVFETCDIIRINNLEKRKSSH